WPLLANSSDGRSGFLGDHSFPWSSWPTGLGACGEYAVAVLLLGAFYSCVLCRWFACPYGLTLHDDGFLAVLGSSFVGGRLPRTIYDHHGRLHLCASRRRL